MDERVLKKRLQKMLAFAIGMGLVMVIAGFVFVNMISHTLEESTRENMQQETEEYIRRFQKQVNTDFQLLYTTASIISDTDLENNSDFVSILNDANTQNDFLSMFYFDQDETGLIVTLDRDPNTHVILSDLNEEIQRVVLNALQGEEGISNLFVGDYTKEKVFLYAVPVYEDNQIVGVLAATNHVEIFSDILSGNGVMGGTGKIHLLDSEGNFLIRANNPINDQDVTSIFDDSYGNMDTQKKEYKKAMENGDSIYSSFVYDSIPYRMYLSPVGINGWTMCCVNSVQASNALVYHIIEILAIFFLAVVVMIAFILLYGYRMVSRNNKQLFYLAYHDQLTGQYNFIYFQQLAQKQALNDPNGCLVCLNIRQFKFMNEIFGREASDRFLKHMANTISKALKEGEFFCRESADYFYIYLLDVDKAVLEKRLDDLMYTITHFDETKDQSYQILLICGAVVSDQKTEIYTFDEMMTHVMFALDKARETHQNSVWFFDAKLHEKEILNSTIEGNMYQALENHEFKIYLQPKIDLATEKLGGAEALVRWIRSDGTMIYPNDFIPLFENNGFCARLDLYMFEGVCQLIQEWMGKGLDIVPISINQSKRIFFDPSYIDKLKELIDRYKVPASLITLEILEGMALEDVDRFNQLLEALKTIGFHISMDDFGSGYSSLNTLSKLKIDELKIDRAFLMTVSKKRNQKERLIMETIVQLSKRMHLSTVVEGVETEEDEALIKELGCDYGQGYLYSRPLPINDFTSRYLES